MLYSMSWINIMEVKIIRSSRKSFSIQIDYDETVTVRAPRRATKKDIEKIVVEKEDWIRKTLQKIRDKKAKTEYIQQDPLTIEEMRELANKALIVIPQRVKHFAQIMGVNYGRITIRNQKTRWGSCSGKGNLNFNCLLMLTPPEVIDYVVVHELCHLIEMNHSKAFWNEVGKIIPNYKDYVKWLKVEGSAVMRRLKG